MDPFRLAVVDTLLASPLAIPQWTSSRLARLQSAEDGGSPVLKELQGLLERSQEIPPRALAPPPSFPEAKSGASFLDLLNAACRFVTVPRERAFSHLSAEEFRILWSEAHRLLEESREDRDKSLFELEREEWETTAWGERLLSQMSRLDLHSYLSHGIHVLSRLEEEGPKRAGSWTPADSVVRVEWEGGWAMLGTKGRDIFRGSASLILDPGGDDLYLLDPPESPAPLSVIIDLGGNDTYQGGDRAPYASGFFGIALLLDQEGDDRYQGGSFTLGAGWCGIGYLRDASGFDTYQGDIFVEGAGCCGIGLLQDEAGGDTYAASLESQGFGFVGGAGLLRDREGRDLYAIRPLYTDVLRYQDHVLSLSQGFAYGWRPHWSGGVGILWDEAGHDVYLADIFGQGGSYWFGLGLLADDTGHDTYTGFQYVQGSGVHLGVGVLRDAEGNDHYQAKGVSQGCGHDWAPGFLLDERGEDVYVAADLSQGAGSANGFGLLWDGGGSDAYYARDSVSTQGYGNPRRGYGSIGLVVDASGRDHFHNRSRNGPRRPWEAMWAQGSRWGALVDARGEEEESRVWPPDEPLPVPERPYSIPELFAMASSGEPKFRLYREHGLEGLRERGKETVRSLLHLLGTPDARDRNTVREILVDLDSLSLEPLVGVLEAGGPEPSWAGEGLAPAPPRDPVALRGWRRRERRLVCDILGRTGRPEALPAVLSVLEDTSWTHRAAAAEAVGRIGAPEAAAAICAILDDPHPQVRVKGAWALGRIESDSVVPCLVEALGDPYFGVRWIASAALARRPEGWEALRHRLAGGDEDLWIMALDVGCAGGAPEDTATCVDVLGVLLEMSRESLSRGGVSLSPTTARLAESLAVPEAVREELLEWMQRLPRRGITGPAPASGPGSN
jgi:hypothetical protein